ncbi:MAG: hypothetical protein PF690_16265 [Deltaproteobacteria bacterium]|jgi:hypothetical protein|nr:hypothetical protein [Deltaproteobacteria bacterium]
MRQKIRFEKNVKKNSLTVFESSEVDPGVVIKLLEEEYNLDEMVEASKKSYQVFTQALRKKSFFPTSDCCAKLFANSMEFFKNKKEIELVIEYDDIEAFPGEEEFQIDDDVEIDKILEDDGDTKEDEMKEIDSDEDTPKFTPEDTSEHEN